MEISGEDYGLSKDSVVLLEQVRTIDKKRLRKKIGIFDEQMMKKVDEGLRISLNLVQI